MGYTSIFGKSKTNEDISKYYSVAIYPTFINGHSNNNLSYSIEGNLSADKTISYAFNSNWDAGLMSSVVSSFSNVEFIKGVNAGNGLAELGIGMGTTGFTTRKVFKGTPGPAFSLGIDVINDGTQEGAGKFYNTLSDLNQLMLPQTNKDFINDSKDIANLAKNVFKVPEKEDEGENVNENKKVETVESEKSILEVGANLKSKYGKQAANLMKDASFDITSSPSDFIIIVGNYFGASRAIMDSVQFNYSDRLNLYGPISCSVELQFSLRYTPKITTYDNGDLSQIDNIFIGLKQVEQLKTKEGI